MNGVARQRRIRVAAGAAAVAAAAVLVAACGSSGQPAARSAGQAGNATKAGAAGTATITTRSGPLGTYLTDGSGRTLYMFASDSATKSTCNNACTRFWPPMTASSTPAETGGAHGKLAMITRSDGTHQVVYDSHPLYYFSQDSAAGDTTGQGSDNFGAKWWVLMPAGDPITSSGQPGSSGGSSASPSAPASSYSGY
jgi:predicted lipoprotein with Yx(FWY)xxD motif